jgi:fused signal recognition particle receptor
MRYLLLVAVSLSIVLIVALSLMVRGRRSGVAAPEREAGPPAEISRGAADSREYLTSQIGAEAGTTAEAPFKELAPEDRAPKAPDTTSRSGSAVLDAGVESSTGVPSELLASRLVKARRAIGVALGRIFKRQTIDSRTWDSLEEALLAADVGVKLVMELVASANEEVRARKLTDPRDLVEVVRHLVEEMLAGKDRSLAESENPPTTYLFVGVNGSGKTTSIAKLAKRLSRGGEHQVVLAAADTFRAAATEQVEIWGQRVGARVVKGSEGGDPGAVVFDAVGFARAKGASYLLVDTAGRLHTNVNLMQELKKIVRVATKAGAPPSEILLVLDATTGQNGLSQAKTFKEAVDITGIVLTKLDGSAKGGIVLAIEEALGVPVKLVGIGEGEDDLIDFDPKAFAEALFGEVLLTDDPEST